MAKVKNNVEVKEKKENIFKRVGRFLKKKSEEAKKATLLLFVMILLAIITGIFGLYLYSPAKEISVAESTFVSETQKVFDYEKDSEERASQQSKAEEAYATYAEVMDEYNSSDNPVVSGYAGIHSSFLKIAIWIAIILPFLAIAIMFIGQPVNFLFAIINMVIVVPVTAIVYLFNSLRTEKKVDKKPTRSNRSTSPRKIEVVEG